jgi:hypothetical protein
MSLLPDDVPRDPEGLLPHLQQTMEVVATQRSRIGKCRLEPVDAVAALALGLPGRAHARRTDQVDPELRAAADIIDGTPGPDRIFSLGSNDLLRGGAGIDRPAVFEMGRLRHLTRHDRHVLAD